MNLDCYIILTILVYNKIYKYGYFYHFKMKRFLYIYIIITILGVYFVNAALNVELKEPKNNIEIRSDINNINFKCNVTSGGTNIDSIRLYSNLLGSWQQTGSTLFNQNEGIISFLIINVSQGTFSWNCLATIPGETRFAPGNFTFTFTAPENTKPVFNGTIPDQSWQQDKSLNSVINLKNHFFDIDNKPQLLSYQHSGDSNIVITINNGVVSFSQPPGWFGVETVYFTASDGQDSIQSNGVKLTVTKNATDVNQTPVNTAPRITPEIPDQIKKPDDTWTLHLNSYVEDDESSKDSLMWSIVNIGNNVINASLNNLTKEVTFVAIGEGEDTITFVVTDSGGLKDDQDVLVKVNDTEEELENELESFLEIISKEPKDKRVEVEEEGKKIFKIDPSISNEINISWFVDEKKQEEESKKFEYVAEGIGVHKIKVLVEKGKEKVSNEWDVFVKERINKTITASVQNLCGNNQTDNDENCETCPNDVKCGEGEICKEKACVKEERGVLTGFAIRGLFDDFKNIGIKGKIISGAVGGLVLLILIILIIRTRNIRKRKSSMKLTNFDTSKGKKSLFGRFKKKEEFVTSEAKKQVNETNIPSGIEPVVGFINSGLASGDKPREIKKALLKSGWSKKQVKQAFKSIR